jgi:flagellar biosynthesis protein FlhA
MLRNGEVARGRAHLNRFLAIGPQHKLNQLTGISAVDPTYGMPGVWIGPEHRGDAERLGCMIFDPCSVVATQLTEVITGNAAELMGRQELQALLDTLKKTHPAVVQAAEPLFLGGLLQVVRNLLRERVSIRDLVLILDTLADQLETTKDPDELSEFVRAALARQISQQYQDSTGALNVLTVDPNVEEALYDLDAEVGGRILAAIDEELTRVHEMGGVVHVMTSPAIRPLLRRLTQRSHPDLAILSWVEVAPKVRVVCRGLIKLKG